MTETVIVACISGITAVLSAWVAKDLRKLKRESSETHEHVVNHHGAINMRDQQDTRHREVITAIASVDRKVENLFRRVGTLEELEITNPRERVR